MLVPPVLSCTHGLGRVALSCLPPAALTPWSPGRWKGRLHVRARTELEHSLRGGARHGGTLATTREVSGPSCRPSQGTDSPWIAPATEEMSTIACLGSMSAVGRPDAVCREAKSEFAEQLMGLHVSPRSTRV